MLQAMKEEPPLAAKCKDKFLIQSTFITAEKDALPLQEIVRIPVLFIVDER
jgi:vesicle-associated membrane protein-associated protein A